MFYHRKDYSAHEITNHAHGPGAIQVLSKRKLDALGIFRGESGMANSEDRMSRMRARLELSNSLAEIERARAEEIEKKKSEETADLIEKAPIAFEKLKSKGFVVSALTMREIQAAAFKYFVGSVIKDGLKKEVVRQLVVLIRKNPSVLGEAGTAVALAAAEERALDQPETQGNGAGLAGPSGFPSEFFVFCRLAAERTGSFTHHYMIIDYKAHVNRCLIDESRVLARLKFWD